MDRRVLLLFLIVQLTKIKGASILKDDRKAGDSPQGNIAAKLKMGDDEMRVDSNIERAAMPAGNTEAGEECDAECVQDAAILVGNPGAKDVKTAHVGNADAGEVRDAVDVGNPGAKDDPTADGQKSLQADDLFQRIEKQIKSLQNQSKEHKSEIKSLQKQLKEVQSGALHCTTGVKKTSRLKASIKWHYFDVKFNKAFKNEPRVMLSIQDTYQGKVTAIFYVLGLVTTTTTGFKFGITSASSGGSAWIGVAWLACENMD